MRFFNFTTDKRYVGDLLIYYSIYLAFECFDISQNKHLMTDWIPVIYVNLKLGFVLRKGFDHHIIHCYNDGRWNSVGSQYLMGSQPSIKKPTPTFIGNPHIKIS